MEIQRTQQQVVHTGRFWVVLFILTLSMIGALAYAYNRIVTLDKQVSVLSANLSSTTAALYGTKDSLSSDLSNLHSQTTDISATLASTSIDVATAKDNITAVQGQVGGVEQTVGSISGTVSTLKKLSTIDPELLKKYSKVYFLNENYTPAHLTLVPQDYVDSNTRQELFLQEAEPFLLKLLDAAKANGATFYINSGYRSFAKQQSVKSRYSVTYGAGTANSFSADQGYSEHQLGTAVDFITPGSAGQLSTTFANTPSFRWLTENAYKFGFELSYPATNTYYVYEPWHWRFVGIKLATYLHEHKLNFYDMDQRDIDTYLADLFD